MSSQDDRTDTTHSSDMNSISSVTLVGQPEAPNSDHGIITAAGALQSAMASALEQEMDTEIIRIPNYVEHDSDIDQPIEHEWIDMDDREVRGLPTPKGKSVMLGSGDDQVRVFICTRLIWALK
jgi:hypothetical protein